MVAIKSNISKNSKKWRSWDSNEIVDVNKLKMYQGIKNLTKGRITCEKANSIKVSNPIYFECNKSRDLVGFYLIEK